MTELVNMGIISGGTSWLWFFIMLLAGVILLKMLFSSNKKTQSKKRADPIGDKSNQGRVEQEPNTRKLSDEEIISADLAELDSGAFDRLISLYYRDRGYRAQLIDNAETGEVDLILTDPGTDRKIAVQCNHWKTKNVENETILKLYAKKRTYKCLDAWCITTSDYTKSAKETAERLNIELLDGQHVQHFIGNWQKRKKAKSNREREIG